MRQTMGHPQGAGFRIGIGEDDCNPNKIWIPDPVGNDSNPQNRRFQDNGKRSTFSRWQRWIPSPGKAAVDAPGTMLLCPKS